MCLFSHFLSVKDSGRCVGADINKSRGIKGRAQRLRGPSIIVGFTAHTICEWPLGDSYSSPTLKSLSSSDDEREKETPVLLAVLLRYVYARG